MSFKQKHILFIIPILLISIGFSVYSVISKTTQVTLKTQQTIFNAGATIELRFTQKEQEKVLLYTHSSYGIAVVEAIKEKETLVFKIPKHIASKKGIIDYKLVHKTNIVFEGTLSIQANPETKTKIESYIGPPSITAGGIDYAMMVVVPTDSFDNPVPDSTVVNSKHQFLALEKEKKLFSKDFIAWQNIFSYTTSGRILASNEVNKTSTKAFAIEVFPAQPTNFTITSERKHKYADGNQITTLVTSVIKDKYNNTISDGTLVSFLVKNSKGVILKTNGISLNGIAKGKLLHPDYKETWEIKAYVTGMAESNKLIIKYEPVINDFKVDFQQNNRKISVGPLQSFMQQIIPDGAVIKCHIYSKGVLIESKIKTSFKGIVHFLLIEGFYPKGNYDFEIEGLGVKKEYKNIKL